MTLGIDRDVTDGVYWLNMKDPAPYGAVVSHTNFIPPERYGGRILYLASYFQGSMDPALPGRMADDFCSRFGVAPASIRWKKMAVEPFAGPVDTTGYRSHIPAYEQGGLFLAGMFSLPNYPERSMEGSIVAGTEVARRMGEGTLMGDIEVSAVTRCSTTGPPSKRPCRDPSRPWSRSPLPSRLIIAEDGSTDGTAEFVRKKATADPRIRLLHADRRLGRGRALTRAFSEAKGRIVCYYDVDLATDLAHLGELIGAVTEARISRPYPGSSPRAM